MQHNVYDGRLSMASHGRRGPLSLALPSALRPPPIFRAPYLARSLPPSEEGFLSRKLAKDWLSSIQSAGSSVQGGDALKFGTL